MKIAWFSPLLGHSESEPKFDSNSRAAYTTFYLVPLLKESFEIDLFYNGPATNVLLNGGISAPVYNFLNAAIMAEDSPYDLYVYQVEDSPYSGWVRHHVGLKPGIVCFHDILFRNRAPDPLSHSPWMYVIEELKEKEIVLPEQEVWPETNDPYPWRESLLALGALFFSPWAHGEYRRRITGKRSLVQSVAGDNVITPSATIVYPLVPNNHKTMSRGIGIFGSADNEDRVSKILAATNNSDPLTWFVKSHEQISVERFLKLYPQHNVLITVYDSPNEFKSLMSSVGILFLLHYSLFGSLSPWIEIAQEAGVVCAVSDYGIAEYIPDSEVIKIPVGYQELWYLREVLKNWQAGSLHVNKCCEAEISSYDQIQSLAHEFTFFIENNRALWQQGALAWQRLEEWSSETIDKAYRESRGTHV